MRNHNTHSGAGMRLIVVFQKYCCDYRKTCKYHDRKDEHGCNGRDKIVKSK